MTGRVASPHFSPGYPRVVEFFPDSSGKKKSNSEEMSLNPNRYIDMKIFLRDQNSKFNINKEFV